LEVGGVKQVQMASGEACEAGNYQLKRSNMLGKKKVAYSLVEIGIAIAKKYETCSNPPRTVNRALVTLS